jgi:hypothetical protein
MKNIGGSYRLEDYLEEESYLSIVGLSLWNFPESLEL